MEKGDSSGLNEEPSISIPRGGPIFVQDFVSPPIRASVFESDVFNELESLKAELDSEPTDLEEDISLDELKIYSDEDLVAEAMKIAFEDDLEARTFSGIIGDPSTSGAENNQRKLDADKSASFESFNDGSSDLSCNGEKDDTKSKQRKRNARKKGESKNGRTEKVVDHEKDKDVKRMLDEDTSASSEPFNGGSSDTSYDGEKDEIKSKKRKRNARLKGKSKNGRTGKVVDHEKDKDVKRMLDADTSASFESLNGGSSDTSYDGEKDYTRSKKRKRNARNKGKSKNGRTGKVIDHEKDKDGDDSYLAKVEHLARIRQKQEEDKASVKLHSFNRDKDSTTAVSSRNIETLKYLESCSCPVKMKSSLTGKPGPIHYPEVILCVEVYHNKNSWQKTQEYLVLGGQFLTELRDKIRCLTDMVMRKAEAYDPSGYFLIEEVFCNDTRDPSSIDYSEPIFDWLKNRKEEALAKWNSILSGVGKGQKVPMGSKPISKLPNFRSVDMHKTRFCDLVFRLGAGYLYCHQGDCKHVIVIRDMRLIHSDDVQNRAAYPLLVYQAKAVLKKCSVCCIYKATKVTLDDKLAGQNPCYFCDNCYYLLHYSAEGKLLYSTFTVHDYLQDYS